MYAPLRPSPMQPLRFAKSLLAFCLLLAACLLPHPALAQSGSLAVANFSFEAPTISNYDEVKSGYAMMQAHTNVAWTFTDYAGIGLAEYFNKDASGVGQLAPDGSQVAYVQSYYNYPPGTISQSVSGFQPGQSYYVIVAAAQGAGNTGGTPLPVQVSLGGQSYTFTPSSTQYQDYTFGPFTGSAGSQTLQFEAVTQSNQVDSLAMIDNMRVVAASNAYRAPVVSSYDEFM